MSDHSSRLTVLHVLFTLETGGAETMMMRVVTGSDAARFRHVIVSLTTVGPIGEELRRNGFEVMALNLSRRFPNPFVIWKVRRLIARIGPDVVKSWLYYADVVAALAARRRPVIWGIHNLSFDPAFTRRSLRATARLSAMLSRWIPWRIVLDAHTAAAVHEAIGYDRRAFVIIPNGCDTDVFTPGAASSALRYELGVGQAVPFVGLIARFHPFKDHRTFLEAAAMIRREVPDTHFVLCGGYGITPENETLMRWIGELRLDGAIHLLGRRDDLPAVMASLDVGVCSSLVEAFPLAVGELMASGVPSVVTDTGDTRLLVGDTATVVPTRDPRALADGCIALLRLPADERRARGAAARRRVVDHFSMTATIRAYETLFEEAARA